MYDVVTVGEGMLRLSPPRYERIRRMRTLDVHMCGSQGNVACNIARLGLKTAFVTKLPDNALGLLAKDHYMSCGVDASHIQAYSRRAAGGQLHRIRRHAAGQRRGLRPQGQRGQHDRPRRFRLGRNPRRDAAGLHGRHFPGLSTNCRGAAVEFVAAAKRNRCLVGFDVNYREHLWSPEEAKTVMSEIIPSVDILITTQWDSETVFGYRGSYEEIIRRFHKDFGCPIVAITLREVYDVLRGAWNTMVLHEGKVLHGQKYEIDVIDRFGAGDSWGSGFLYAYLTSNDVEYAMNFGNAVLRLAPYHSGRRGPGDAQRSRNAHEHQRFQGETLMIPRTATSSAPGRCRWCLSFPSAAALGGRRAGRVAAGPSPPERHSHRGRAVPGGKLAQGGRRRPRGPAAGRSLVRPVAGNRPALQLSATTAGTSPAPAATGNSTAAKSAARPTRKARTGSGCTPRPA